MFKEGIYHHEKTLLTQVWCPANQNKRNRSGMLSTPSVQLVLLGNNQKQVFFFCSSYGLLACLVPTVSRQLIVPQSERALSLILRNVVMTEISKKTNKKQNNTE